MRTERAKNNQNRNSPNKKKQVKKEILHTRVYF